MQNLKWSYCLFFPIISIQTPHVAVTKALTHFLLNPLKQVNWLNPRFLGFTWRMKPPFEYSGYHSGHFASLTGIGIEIPGSSECWEHQSCIPTSPLWSRSCLAKCVRYSFLMIAENTFAYLFFFRFSFFYKVLFVFHSLQDQNIQAFGLAKPRTDNTSEQRLLPPSQSHLHYIEECQTSHEVKLFLTM